LSGPVRSVAVVGRDASAWIAAAMLKRALGRASIDVHVVELPSLLQPADVYAAVPSVRGLHRALGLKEEIVLRTCDPVPMVGQRFSNWSQSAPPFLLAFENEPPPGGDLSFVQYWIKAQLEGLKVDLSHFAAGTAAAQQGRVPVDPVGSAAIGATFGYHLDARSYVAVLKKFALHNGVTSISARAIEAEATHDSIASIMTDDGTRVSADLFVDATGAEALLLRKLDGTERRSWADLFPADRMLVASAPPLRDLPAFSQISAMRAGWVGLFPLRSRTAVIAVYDSSHISDGELIETLPVIARMPVQGDAFVSSISSGIESRPWTGNCVAVGEAAVSTDLVDAVQIHLIQGCVSHLVNMFPVDKAAMPEAAEYNRVVYRFAENVRDFQLAHYKLNRRFDDPFWDAAREVPVPETLQRKVGLFEQRGLVPLYDDESFFEWNWAQLFLGHGIRPQDYEPRIDQVPDQDHVAKVQGRMHEVAQLVRSLPSVGEFLGSATQVNEAGADA
jgi:tryptophan halogenase